MKTLVKPNGTEVQVNDKSLEYALSLGWKEKKKPAPKQPAKRGRKKAE